jgi:ribonuclease HII
MDSAAKLKFLKDFRSRGTVAGADEAGRGPLAGPLTAAAVILTETQEEELLRLGLKDSKLMTPRKREALFLAMRGMGVLWRAQAAGVASIARLNVGRASLWAMEKSVRKLPPPIDLVVVDGLYRIPNLPFEQLPLVAADVLVPVVSAASVIAKVLRDRIMAALDKLYPSYGFARHKGYPTKFHKEAVRAFGLSAVHRASFCKKLMFESLGGGAFEEFSEQKI